MGQSPYVLDADDREAAELEAIAVRQLRGEGGSGMTDRKFSDVAPRYAAWETHEQHLGELRRELAEEREVIGIIARERNELRAENAGLAMRLEHSEARTEWLRKRLSRWDVWAGLVLAWWHINERS